MTSRTKTKGFPGTKVGCKGVVLTGNGLAGHSLVKKRKYCIKKTYFKN